MGPSEPLDIVIAQLTDNSPSGLCEGLAFNARTRGTGLRQCPLDKSGPRRLRFGEWAGCRAAVASALSQLGREYRSS